MQGKSPILSAKKREKTGTRYNNRLRASGSLPAVVYGHGQGPISITLDSREAITHINKGEKLFRLDFPGVSKGDLEMVLLKDVQFDYLGTNVVHADFARVDLNQRVKTKVPVHLVGEAIGLKQAGAILMHPTNELVIECTVSELPEFIELTIGHLDVGNLIAAGDVKLPTAGMKLITDPHAIVAQIVIQQEIVVGEATVAGTDSAEPEVITAKKPADGEEGAKPAGKDAKAAPGKDAKAAPKK
jgi:large subunit ribosomal protein L25